MAFFKKNTREKPEKPVGILAEGYQNRGLDAAVPRELFEEYTTTGLLEDRPGTGYELVSAEDGSSVHFSKESVLVGCREDLCDFVIAQDPKNHRVSREHAYLIMNEGKVFVKDISANGTFLGLPETPDKEMFRLPKDTEVEVRDGQIIRFADRKYQIKYTQGKA